MQRHRACSIAVATLLGALVCVTGTADLSNTAQSAENNGITYYPATTTYTLASSTPSQGTAWVSAPTTAGGQWVTQPAWPAATPSLPAGSAAAAAAGSGPDAGADAAAGAAAAAGASEDPTAPGRWHRMRRHRHNYPPGAAAGTAVPTTPLSDSSSSSSSMAVGSATTQPGMTRTFMPGKGWVTIVWAPGTAPTGPDMQGVPSRGPAGGPMGGGPGGPMGVGPASPMGGGPGGPGPGPNWPGPGAPDGQPNMQPPGQPGMGPPGGMGGTWQGPGTTGTGPMLPGGPRRIRRPGMGIGIPAIPMQSPIPAGSWGGSNGGSGGPWSSSWPAPSPRPDDDNNINDDEEPYEPSAPPQWPWPGSPLSPGSSGSPSSPATAGLNGGDDNDNDSMMGGPGWVGAGPGPRGPRPGPWAAAGASPRPSSGSIAEAMWPARLSSPRPQPSVATGPSKTDPDRPWLSRSSPSPPPSPSRPGASSPAQPSRGAPSPSPSPGVRAPWGVGPGATTRPGDMPRASPSPSKISASSTGSTVGEWDEGVGDDGSDDKVPPSKVPSPPVTTKPTDKPGMGPGPKAPGMGVRNSPSPSGAATALTGLSPRPGPPLRGGSSPGLAGTPSPRPFVLEDPEVMGPEDDSLGPLGGEDSPEDVDIVDTTAAAGAGDKEDAASATGAMGPVSGLVTGGGLVRPGSGIGSAESAPTSSSIPAAAGMGPGAATPGALAGRGNATAAAAAGGPARPGTGPAAGPQMGPGAGASPGGLGMGPRPGSGTVTEAGSRGGNASSTAAALPTSFTLSPAISQPPGAGGAGSIVVPTAVASNGSMDGSPKPYMFRTQGAKKTVQVGCILPFEGDQAVVAKAVHQALQMALQDFGGSLKGPVNINLTCFNTKCTDIPSYNAMRRLADMGVVGVIGEICSSATVAAAGVAGERKVPLISPASSSPQLTGMPFFRRTVPSDRYQGAAAANLAITNGFKNIGMVYEEASYGHGLAFNFMASLTRDGGSVPVVIPFKRGQGNPKAAVAKLVEAKAAKANPLDAVYVSTNNLTYFGDFVRAAAAAKLGLPIFGGDAIASPGITDTFKDNPALLKPVVITAFAQGSEAFKQKFAKAAPGLEYDGNAAQGYDAMRALLRAYDDAPASKEPENVAAGIIKQEFEGVSGPVAFDAKGDLKPHNGVYITAKFDPTNAQLVLGKAIPLPP